MKIILQFQSTTLLDMQEELTRFLGNPAESLWEPVRAVLEPAGVAVAPPAREPVQPAPEPDVDTLEPNPPTLAPVSEPESAPQNPPKSVADVTAEIKAAAEGKRSRGRPRRVVDAAPPEPPAPPPVTTAVVSDRRHIVRASDVALGLAGNGEEDPTDPVDADTAVGYALMTQLKFDFDRVSGLVSKQAAIGAIAEATGMSFTSCEAVPPQLVQKAIIALQAVHSQ